MYPVYRCDKCGFETSNREEAENHDCKKIYKVKEIRLELNDDGAWFFKEVRSRSTDWDWDEPDERVSAWNSDTIFVVETTDLSREKEIELKQVLVKTARRYYTNRREDIDRVLSKLRRPKMKR